MGIITHYQRQKLASQAVGVLPADKSGQILASGFKDLAAGVATFAMDMQKRQQAIDKLDATKAFYDFVQQDVVADAELKNKMQDDPQSFIGTYNETSKKLQQSVGQKLSGEVKTLFDTKVEEYRARKSVTDGEWIFNQQARNALNTAAELGEGFVNNAMTLSNPDEFMGLVTAFNTTSENDIKPLISPKSYTKYKGGVQKNMALSFLAGQKSTNPVRLETEMKKDSSFTRHLRKVLGEKEFSSQLKQIQRFRKQFIDDLGFETIVTGKTAAVEFLNTLMTNPSAFSYAKAEQQYAAVVNQLNKMKEDNKIDGRYEKAIPAQEKTVEAFKYLKDIASNLGDADIVSDTVSVSKLLDDIKDIQAEFKGKHKDIDSVRKEVKSFGFNLAGAAAVGSRITSKKGKTANKHYSEYVAKMYDIQAKAFKLRAERQITNKDFNNIINKIIVPLSEANEFARMTDGRGIGFDTAWNDFEKFASNIYGDGEDKNTAKTEMLKNYMLEINKVLEMGQKPDPEFIAATIRLQKLRLAKQIYPEFAALQQGDSITIKGRQVPFVGFDPITGKPLVKTPKGIEVEFDNL